MSTILSSVAGMVPFGGGIMNAALAAYNFKKRWQAMVDTVALFEGTVFNVMQKDGLYTKILLSAKLSSLDDIPSNIYSTGHFFNVITSLLKLVAEWNKNIATLKESDDWGSIEDLLKKMDKVPKEGEHSEEEINYLQNEIKGVFNNTENLSLATDHFVNCLILKEFLKYKENFVSKIYEVDPDYGQYLATEQHPDASSLADNLTYTITNNANLRELYGDDPDPNTLYKYCEDRIINKFYECLSKSANGNSMCSDLELDIPKTVGGKQSSKAKNEVLLMHLIEPQLTKLVSKINKDEKNIDDVPKDVHVQKPAPPKKKGFFSGMKSKAKSAASSVSKGMSHAKEAVAKHNPMPDRLKAGFRQAYLATFLDMYEAPANALFQEYSMTLATLTLEVNYESWQGEVELANKDNKDYKKWLEQSREVVKHISNCVTEDKHIGDLDKSIKKEGFSCVLIDTIHDHLDDMDLSPAFTDVLKSHVSELTKHSVSKDTQDKHSHKKDHHEHHKKDDDDDDHHDDDDDHHDDDDDDHHDDDDSEHQDGGGLLSRSESFTSVSSTSTGNSNNVRQKSAEETLQRGGEILYDYFFTE